MKGLTDHVNPAAYYAGSVANEVAGINATIETLEGLNDDGSPAKKK